ncbi:MAG: hypothetical protein M0Q21_01665 [Ignavibacteriaceae bacterium]|nr:hypothetical protein [Ignavibacteriaceae bacterium]
MSRIINTLAKRSFVFHELHTVAYYSESELEDKLFQHFETLFPDFYFFPFKINIKDQNLNKKKQPDYSFLKKDLTEWWVVEVELYGHPVSHVKDQVDTFLNGDYNSIKTAKYISSQLKKYCHVEIQKAKIGLLVQEMAPRIMIIVDKSVENWENEFAGRGVKIFVFELYKNTEREYVFRLKGDYPIIKIHSAHCRFCKYLRNTLEITSDCLFLDNFPDNLEINIGDRLTSWQRIKSEDKMYLQFIGSMNPLANDGNYSLIIDSQNNLYIKNN